MKSAPIILAALALAAPASLAAKGGDIVTHQRNAGTPDADGFVHAKTMTGGMVVDMPCRFTEMSFDNAQSKDGKTPYANAATIVACNDGTGATAMVVRADYDTGAAGADHFFEQQKRDDAVSGTVTEADLGGRPAFYSQSRKGRMCRWKFAVREGASLVSLNYFGQADDCATREARARRFVTSLEFAE